MQKWEYLEVVVGFMGEKSMAAERVNDQTTRNLKKGDKEYPKFYKLANELGEQGWEMCGIAGSDSRRDFVAYFRRPLA